MSADKREQPSKIVKDERQQARLLEPRLPKGESRGTAWSKTSVGADVLQRIEQRLNALAATDSVSASSINEYWQNALDVAAKKETEADRKQALKEVARELARGSGFSIAELYGSANPARKTATQTQAVEIFYHLREVIEEQLKSGRAVNPRNLKSVIASETGNSKYSRDIFNMIIAELRNSISGDEQLKRKYRRRAELPDPTLPADAEVNRPTQQLKLRVEPSIIEAIDAAVATSDRSRSEWMTEAAIEKIKRENPDLYNEISQVSNIEP